MSMNRRTLLSRLASILAAPLALAGWRTGEAKAQVVEPVVGGVRRYSDHEREEFERLLKELMQASYEYYGVERPR